MRRGDDDLGERPDRQQDRDPVTGPVRRRLRCDPHHARALAAESEGQVGALLVGAPGVQDVREHHSRGAHLDHDVVRSRIRLVDLLARHARRAPEPVDPNRQHGATFA